MPSPLAPLPTPPDGGYGWVIVGTCFLYQALVDGSFSVIAVFMPYFVDQFEAGSGRTAVVGSVFMGSMLISGPVVSMLTHLLGCRAVAMLGGLLLSLGYFLATLAPTVEILVLTLGFIGGFGLGMLYLPSVVMCGNYFERKRALAMGITASGAGVGMLVFAPLSSALLSVYDWHNGLRLLTCFTLQSIVAGALLRPLTAKLRTNTDSEDTESTSAETEESPQKLDNCKLPSPTQDLMVTSSDNLRQMALVNSANRQILSKPNSPLASHESLETGKQRLAVETSPGCHGDKEDINNPCSVSSHNVSQCQGQLKDYSVNENLLSRTYGNLNTVNLPDNVLDNRRIYYSYDDVHKGDNRRLSTRPKTESQTKDSSVNMNRPEHFRFKPFLRKDVFYSGSIARLPEYRSEPRLYKTKVIVDDDIQQNMTANSDDKSCLCLPRKHVYILRRMLDVSVLSDGYFIAICLANMCMQMGYFIPIMFITDYAQSINIGPGMASTLISLFGLSNTLGRVAGGALSSIPRVDPVHVSGLSLILSGGFCSLCVFCTQYATLAASVAATGFFVAPIIPLANVFLVDYLGLDKLTNTVGLMSLAKGVASLFGAPLAGHLLDSTQSFRACFFLAGGLFSLSGALHYLLPLITRYRKSRGGAAVI